MKKYIYIISWVVLVLLLSFLAHAGLEIATINYAAQNEIILTNYTAFGYGYCVLPTIVQITLILSGIVGGFLLGRYFWRTIYVEKRYESKMVKFFQKKS
jgi:hypothetical protein